MSQIETTQACLYCNELLGSPDEIATGLCSRHLEEISRSDHLIGICWNCGNITHISEIPKRLKQVFRDKYLFTRSCSLCSGTDDDNVNWVTFNTFVPDHHVMVGPTGQLVRVEGPSPTTNSGKPDPVRSYPDKKIERNEDDRESAL